MQHNRRSVKRFGSVRMPFLPGADGEDSIAAEVTSATGLAAYDHRMEDGALKGQVAFVTGGGSGLGAAFARRLAADGATVVVNDLDATAAAAIAIEVNGDTAVFDVCDAVAFDAEVDKAVERHGRIDIMVNNAGIAPPSDPARVQQMVANQMARMEGRLADMVPPDSTVSLSDADWDRMIRVHLYGTFHGTRAALRHMTPAVPPRRRP